MQNTLAVGIKNNYLNSAESLISRLFETRETAKYSNILTTKNLEPLSSNKEKKTFLKRQQTLLYAKFDQQSSLC
jgi:hypothetical protein